MPDHLLCADSFLHFYAEHSRGMFQEHDKSLITAAKHVLFTNSYLRIISISVLQFVCCHFMNKSCKYQY
jgi:hypothetical protein